NSSSDSSLPNRRKIWFRRSTLTRLGFVLSVGIKNTLPLFSFCHVTK
ncbi:unnamed protein product, partial [Brassica oleracea]